MPPAIPWHPHPPAWQGLPAAAARAWREDYEERAAILEYLGGHSRSGAEIRAYALVVERMVHAGAANPADPAVREQRDRRDLLARLDLGESGGKAKARGEMRACGRGGKAKRAKTS